MWTRWFLCEKKNSNAFYAHKGASLCFLWVPPNTQLTLILTLSALWDQPSQLASVLYMARQTVCVCVWLLRDDRFITFTVVEILLNDLSMFFISLVFRSHWVWGVQHSHCYWRWVPSRNWCSCVLARLSQLILYSLRSVNLPVCRTLSSSHLLSFIVFAWLLCSGAKPRRRKPFNIPGRRKDKDVDSTWVSAFYRNSYWTIQYSCSSIPQVSTCLMLLFVLTQSG